MGVAGCIGGVGSILTPFLVVMKDPEAEEAESGVVTDTEGPEPESARRGGVKTTPSLSSSNPPAESWTVVDGSLSASSKLRDSLFRTRGAAGADNELGSVPPVEVGLVAVLGR